MAHLKNNPILDNLIRKKCIIIMHLECQTDLIDHHILLRIFFRSFSSSSLEKIVCVIVTEISYSLVHDLFNYEAIAILARNCENMASIQDQILHFFCSSFPLLFVWNKFHFPISFYLFLKSFWSLLSVPLFRGFLLIVTPNYFYLNYFLLTCQLMLHFKGQSWQ